MSRRNLRGFIQLTLAGYAMLGMGIVILSLGIGLKIQTARLESVKSEYAGFVASVKAEGEKAKAKAEAEIKRQKEVTKNVEKNYAKRLDSLRADYARLRESRSGVGGVPGIPAPPRSLDEVPADGIPLAAICAETTEQLVSLQEWVREQANR